ncbi:radical SAM protein [Lyngbya confervoides BDU141951]|uniref:Radical SAM protein n=2 Tax=Lyngbya TaxID=28073 RepID=A0ABD4T0V4_9CYAN|nr:4Fe-4S single cluster domain-containing protein [Lyngbya confervoides]MCM1982235.1 radical SAM protein [Lyngbya confervoides BDU141951]
MRSPQAFTSPDLSDERPMLNLMGYVDCSEVNGPGRRAVVWLQGCVRACPGCFNPASWSTAPNQILSVEELVARILGDPLNQGVTFSGGEPFLQALALTQVAKRVKAQGLNVMSFTGFTLDQLKGPQAPPGSESLLAQLDLLVDGPYVESLAIHSPTSLVSSRNQQVHRLNPRLSLSLDWASDQVEVHILKDGQRIITGYRGEVLHKIGASSL